MFWININKTIFKKYANNIYTAKYCRYLDEAIIYSVYILDHIIFINIIYRRMLKVLFNSYNIKYYYNVSYHYK